MLIQVSHPKKYLFYKTLPAKILQNYNRQIKKKNQRYNDIDS